MEKLKSLLAVLLVIAAIFPFYFFHQYLLRVTRPRENGGRFLLYIFLTCAGIFIYTFLVVLIVKLILRVD